MKTRKDSFLGKGGSARLLKQGATMIALGLMTFLVSIQGNLTAGLSVSIGGIPAQAGCYFYPLLGIDGNAIGGRLVCDETVVGSPGLAFSLPGWFLGSIGDLPQPRPNPDREPRGGKNPSRIGVIPRPGCRCADTAMNCYNMRREVEISISNYIPGWANPNHTFTKCYGHNFDTYFFEDNWATPGESERLSWLGEAGGTWMVEELGCIESESLEWAKSAANSLTNSRCPGYNTCASENESSTCQDSYLFNGGDSSECFCYPWQEKFRVNLRGSYVQVCQ